MKRILAMLVLTCLAGAAAGSAAGGPGVLAAVPRKIGKQPAYTGKPAYGLLAFGADAATRVWLVLDGTTLYVDKNGNGDLTETGERFALADAPAVDDTEECKVTEMEFAVGDLPPVGGKSLYTDVNVTRRTVEPKGPATGHIPASDVVVVSVLLRGASTQKAAPVFAAKPDDAPVVHFDGPLTLSTPPTPKGEPAVLLMDAQEPSVLTLQIGTPGLGTGTWAALGYEQVPESVHPVIEISFPPLKAGDPPVQKKYTLDERC